jgi:protein SCO1
VTVPAAARGSRLVVAAALIAGLVVLAAGGLSWLLLAEPPSQGPFSQAVGGAFKLIDQDGKTVTDRDLRGKWLLVYFGYTHCPDACPTALNDIALALRALTPQQRAEVRPVFVTVDPQRDTPAVMKEYVKAFDAPILALSGSPAAVAQAARAYRVYYARHDLPGGDYEMDHSSIIYVMDPEGRFVASLTEQNSPQQIADALRQRLG